jgi:hypothetical protein
MKSKLILDTTATLFEALGHLKQAEVLLINVLAQDPETYALADAASLTVDAVSQLTGELRNRQEQEKAA